MYYLFQNAADRRHLSKTTLAFIVALLVAELFFKFGSFSLECIAFLATWFGVDLIIDSLVRLRRRGGPRI